MKGRILFSYRPASRFGEAYPLGNGRLGGMVFGGAERERLLISENTFFSGGPSDGNSQTTAPAAFRRMREYIRAGLYEEAAGESSRFIGRRGNYGTNLPVGDLFIHCEGAGPIGKYARRLDIGSGVALSSYERGEGREERKTWISSALNCLVHDITSSSPLDFTVNFVPYSRKSSFQADGEGLSFRTKAVEELHSDGRTGVSLFGRVQILTDGKWDSRECRVTGSRRTILLLTCLTDLMREDIREDRAREELTGRLNGLDRERLAREEKVHIEEMEELFNRSVLELENEETLPLLYHYGRYLLYSSSRKESALPAHLQGIWNDNVACRIGWTCDMHLDINTQMNYWPSEVTGLSEVNEPLFSWLEQIVVPRGRTAARESYGLSGWTAEIVSNSWGFAAPYWGSPIAPCPACGIWILTHLYEHYLFTNDRDFLREKAYPLILESVNFFMDYLFLNNEGYYVGGPAISPENSFLVDGIKTYMSHGSTFEILMIRELFRIYLEASDMIGPEGRDREKEEKVRLLAEKLLPYRIGPEGTLAEWSHDFPAADRQHRHTSHLLGLYPFCQIDPFHTPELAGAAAKSIEEKMSPPEGWEDTGWARSLLLLYNARLGRGDEALAHITAMTEHLLEPNGMIIHPPTRGAASFDNVYEMDGNTGLTAALAEMLVQSHGGCIRLLPALPSSWKKGRIGGLKARGGITLSIEWDGGVPVEVILESDEEKIVLLCWGERSETVFLKGEIRLDAGFFR